MRCVTNPETEIGRVVIDSWMDGSRVDESDLRPQVSYTVVKVDDLLRMWHEVDESRCSNR